MILVKEFKLYVFQFKIHWCEIYKLLWFLSHGGKNTGCVLFSSKEAYTYWKGINVFKLFILLLLSSVQTLDLNNIKKGLCLRSWKFIAQLQENETIKSTPNGSAYFKYITVKNIVLCPSSYSFCVSTFHPEKHILRFLSKCIELPFIFPKPMLDAFATNSHRWMLPVWNFDSAVK